MRSLNILWSRKNEPLVENIFDFCLDKLYIQKSSLKGLLALYPRLNKNTIQIPNTNYFLITSDNCP